MRPTLLLFILLLFSCNKKANDVVEKNDTLVSVDTIQIAKPIIPEKETAKAYSNERFRKVTVEKLDEHTFRINGEAQIFEANFSWVVEDGHNELKKGFEMTDAGAPEWGKFDFTVDAEKKDSYSTLHLILFEASAKDGSRQYELPILL